MEAEFTLFLDTCPAPRKLPIPFNRAPCHSLGMNKPLCIALLVGGIILAIYGVSATNSFGSDVSRFFTGAPTDKAIWMLVGGLAATMLGGPWADARNKDLILDAQEVGQEQRRPEGQEPPNCSAALFFSFHRFRESKSRMRIRPVFYRYLGWLKTLFQQGGFLRE
ncbi:MAG: rane protein [Verrucomicrobiales bacterium]|nr:rane protein [Verrucomicrobiales bacterium]